MEEPGKASADEKSRAELYSVLHPQTPGPVPVPDPASPATGWFCPCGGTRSQRPCALSPTALSAFCVRPKESWTPLGTWRAGECWLRKGRSQEGVALCPSLVSPPSNCYGSALLVQKSGVGPHKDARRHPPTPTPSVALNASAQASHGLQSWDRVGDTVRGAEGEDRGKLPEAGTVPDANRNL